MTKLGALSLLIQELKARGLDCNKIKFACAGTTPDACARKPSWLKEPTTLEATDGSIIHARGIASIFVTILSEKTFMFRHFWRINSTASAKRSNGRLIAFPKQAVTRIS